MALSLCCALLVLAGPAHDTCAAGGTCEKAVPCIDVGDSSFCQHRKLKSGCAEGEMAWYCRKTCGLCDQVDAVTAEGISSLQHGAAESLWQVADAKDKSCRTTGRGCAPQAPDAVAKLEARVAGSGHCADLEDVSRLKDRGFFVLRGAVPRDELEAMGHFVESLPAPTKFLCGASDVQPHECMYDGDEIKSVYPKTFSLITGMFQDWVRTGFNVEARVGWPLEISGSEFISINSWRYAANSSCVFNSLLETALADDEPAIEQCLDKQCADLDGRPSSIDGCWLGCLFESMVTRLPASTIRRVLREEAGEGGRGCSGVEHDVLRGPFEYIMGGDRLWDFGKRDAGETGLGARARGWGDHRCLSNLRAWFTKTFSLHANFSIPPVYQGWHDWHIDGPAEHGRYHKIFVMVNKSTAPAHRALTNVKLVPASALYESFGSFQKYAARAGQREDLMHPPFADGEAGENKRRAWGLRHDWHAYESLGCDIPMSPGDILFFREDVWHRTQDMHLDRVSLIMDVFRLPLLPEGAVLAEGEQKEGQKQKQKQKQEEEEEQEGDAGSRQQEEDLD